MIEEGCPAAKPHDEARVRIESWRGHCLDLFARGEKVIGQTLESVRAAADDPASVRLRHLAGQRSEDLARVLAQLDLTAKQSKTLGEIVDSWRGHEAMRVYLAHAILAVTLDPRGKWFAVFDMTVYRSEQPRLERWTVSESEANELALQLEASWKLLSAQLGQVRKKLGA